MNTSHNKQGWATKRFSPRSIFAVSSPSMKESLPIIHPLRGDKATRWTDETKTKCGCDHCMHWSPLISHLGAQLDDNGKRLLAELVGDWMHQSDDLGAANAMLAGDWPGWEAMKDFKPKYDNNKEIS